MGTALPTGTKSSAPPSIKLRNVGDWVRFAVVDIKLDVPMTEFGTDRPKLNSNGQQMTQHALTVLVTDPGAGVHIVDDNDAPVSAGELHTIYISSYSKWDPERDKVTAPYMSWGGVTDAVGLEVGYVGEWKLIEELAPTRAGNNGRKDRKFRLRAPKPEEEQQRLRCEELRAELQDRTVLQPAGAPAPTPSSDQTVVDEF